MSFTLKRFITNDAYNPFGFRTFSQRKADNKTPTFKWVIMSLCGVLEDRFSYTQEEGVSKTRLLIGRWFSHHSSQSELWWYNNEQSSSEHRLKFSLIADGFDPANGKLMLSLGLVEAAGIYLQDLLMFL